MMKRFTPIFGVFLLLVHLATSGAALAAPQAAAGAQAPQTKAGAPSPAPAGVTPPPGYVIGPEDVLGVLFWREPDMSVEVTVRPDGMITLPLINDFRAAGLSPEELRSQLTVAGAKYIADPIVTVNVKTINSRKVFIAGQVAKPGEYPLTAPTTVVQLIVVAGGLLEFAKSDKIQIIRTERGQQVPRSFNYKDVLKGKNLAQNITLQPGDTILVP